MSSAWGREAKRSEKLLGEHGGCRAYFFCVRTFVLSDLFGYLRVVSLFFND